MQWRCIYLQRTGFVTIRHECILTEKCIHVLPNAITDVISIIGAFNAIFDQS